MTTVTATAQIDRAALMADLKKQRDYHVGLLQEPDSYHYHYHCACTLDHVIEAIERGDFDIKPEQAALVQAPQPSPLCPSCGEVPVDQPGYWCRGCAADFEARR